MDKFSALADPTRRSIIEMLAQRGPLAATEIYAHFTVSHPAISQHLKVLREARLVVMQKRGQQHLYRLNPDTMGELEAWVREMTERWSARFDRLDLLLEEEKKKMEGEEEAK